MADKRADIHVERAHALGKDRALAAGLRVAERMKEKANINYRVVGDAIEFERSGAKGTLSIEAERVTADITLPMLLRPMRGVIEAKLDDYFNRFFV
jgi:putative polyhydroxyalkanoate system protein